MQSVVPLIRDKSLQVSSEGVAVMTRQMCDKGNGSAAITWILTCRDAGAAIDQRCAIALAALLLAACLTLCSWVGRALIACASQGPQFLAQATSKVLQSGALLFFALPRGISLHVALTLSLSFSLSLSLVSVDSGRHAAIRFRGRCSSACCCSVKGCGCRHPLPIAFSPTRVAATVKKQIMMILC